MQILDSSETLIGYQHLTVWDKRKVPTRGGNYGLDLVKIPGKNMKK